MRGGTIRTQEDSKERQACVKKKSPQLHNFARGLCIPQTITNKQKLCMGVFSVSHDCTCNGIRNTGCLVYGLSSKCLLRGLTKWGQQTIWKSSRTNKLSLMPLSLRLPVEGGNRANPFSAVYTLYVSHTHTHTVLQSLCSGQHLGN